MPGASIEDAIEFCANARRVTSKENAHGLAVLEDLIRKTHGLSREEFDERVRQKMAGTPSLHSVEVRRAWETLEKVSGEIVKDSGGFLKFCSQHPGIRRWLVSRLFKATHKALQFQDMPTEKAFLDLHYAPASRLLLEALGPDREDIAVNEIERRLLEFPTDRLGFWERENCDFTVHLPYEQFRIILNHASSYPGDQPIEEGMVFVEISRHEEIRFLQFTVHARKEGEAIFKTLLKREGGGPEGAA